jgi:hypothetical protein
MRRNGNITVEEKEKKENLDRLFSEICQQYPPNIIHRFFVAFS